MKLFYRKKNELNKAEAQFSAADYSVLTYDQLLKVNGAKGGSGGGGGGGQSGPSSNSGSLSSQGYPSSTEGYNTGSSSSNTGSSNGQSSGYGPSTPSSGNLTSQGYPGSTDYNPGRAPSGNSNNGGSSTSSSGNLSSQGYPSSTSGYNPGESNGSPASQGYPSSTEGYNTGGNPNAAQIAALQGAQTNAINNPNYQQGSVGPCNYQDATPDTTWCNQATYDVADTTNSGLGPAMYGNDPHGYNTNANTAAQNLQTNASNPDSAVQEVTPEQAQNLANLGYTVVGAYENTSGGSGHLATVAPGHDYNEGSGPVLANVGLESQTGINDSATVYGSHYTNGEVHFYYNSEQDVY